MTDDEFIEELVTRLNMFLEMDQERANKTLMTPMAHAGYANVGHFLGQFCLPRGTGMDTPAEELKDVKFLLPEVAAEGGITGFRAVTGEQLQEEASVMQQRATEQKAKDSTPH